MGMCGADEQFPMNVTRNFFVKNSTIKEDFPGGNLLKQLSLFDLPAGPETEPDGPSFWWSLRFKPMYEQAVSDFVAMYEVQPVFHLDWPKQQVFLAEPGKALLVDKRTGRLVEKGKKRLWEVDYRTAKAFRPQDVDPQITAILLNAASCSSWRPMVMAEIRVAAAHVEQLLARLDSLDVFSQHWPANQDDFLFRVFCDPDLLDSLVYG